MNVTVVVPWIDRGDEWRQRALLFVTNYWLTHLPDAEVVVEGSEPFSWAAALNNGAKRVRSGVIVHSDPDSIVPISQAVEAIRLAADTDGLVLPFTEYLYLNEEATADLEAERFSLLTARRCHDHGTTGVGNVTVWSKRTWEKAGGFDERFDRAWGGADAAYAYACQALVGPTRRVDGPMFHYWHPRLPESKPGHIEYFRQFELLARYRDAATPADVRKLVEER